VITDTATEKLKPEKEFALERTSQQVLNKTPKYGASYITIFFLTLIIANGTGYYFSFKQNEHAKWSSVVAQKIAPLMVPQTQIDKNIQFLKPAVQVQKAADVRQTEPGNNNDSLPIAKPASLSAFQPAAPSPAIKEHQPATPAPTVASIENKPAQPPAEEKKVVAHLQQKAAVNAPLYCVNVSSCKLRESADVVIKDLQNKNYNPAVETIQVKDSTWYRVTVGDFQTEGEARSYARELQRKENITGVVVEKK
jgi:cell division protein FtsN